MLWGYGPAVDVLEEVNDVESLKSKEELNILMIGFSDGRHILQTMSKYYKHTKRKVNFYVSEVMLDMIARQMLLILTALEPPEKLGLFEKTRLWMELFGNTLVRPKTANYLIKKAYQLINLVTDEVYLSFRLPVVSIGMMKYKERDNLETIFEFWAKKRLENVVSLWDGRLRQSLGTRYDSKEGVFDWDYYMRLKEVPDGTRINAREYKHWRATGVAFTWLESEVCEPNATLASGIVKLGGKLLHHGYLGDIVNPPYLAFGTDCEDKEMLDVQNGINRHRSTDIVEVNLRRMFHEIATQTAYKHSGSEDRQLGVVITELTEVREVPGVGDDTETEDCKEPEDLSRREDYCALPVANTRVVFLSTTALVELPRRPAFRDHFDLVMVSQNLTQRLSEEVVGLARDGAMVLLETRKFITNYSPKEKQDFADHLRQTAQQRHCQPVKPFDGVKDYLAKFKVVRQS